MKLIKLLFLYVHIIFSCGCSHNELPPVRLNDYYRDTKRMESYIKAQGIDKVTLVWSTEGPWSIDLSDSSATDLDWSIGIFIDKLIISNAAIADLSPLKYQKELRWLEANNTKIFDLSPLSQIKMLETLEIENTKVDDLTPIRKIEIMDLNIKGIPCSDLSCIRLDKLRSIQLSLEPSNKWKGLERLRAINNLIINRSMNNATFWAKYDERFGSDKQVSKPIPGKDGE